MTTQESAELITRLTRELSETRAALQAERQHAENLQRVAIAAVQAGIHQVRELSKQLDRGKSRSTERAVPLPAIHARSVAP